MKVNSKHLKCPNLAAPSYCEHHCDVTRFGCNSDGQTGCLEMFVMTLKIFNIYCNLISVKCSDQYYKSNVISVN